MALDQERMAPCHQPKIIALAKVIRKAGRGAATDWRSIRQKETTAAQGPKERMYSTTWLMSIEESKMKTDPSPVLRGGTIKQMITARIMTAQTTRFRYFFDHLCSFIDITSFLPTWHNMLRAARESNSPLAALL
ncbi:hypothetical protein HMPREF0322_02203 [Desulfitobacterium hafniense DP7]|uniref:Uncharacterized protein n=1 Tax=Desulfitobacterium hafniense DP7 TaxID=537010 RepID=G9XML6_DESHA|nr:hypothetical protein HMPREF0322_02203 [Desulfitobacterium hafniense DP7]